MTDQAGRTLAMKHVDGKGDASTLARMYLEALTRGRRAEAAIHLLVKEKEKREALDTIEGLDGIKGFDCIISGVSLRVRWVVGPTAESSYIHSVVAKDGSQDLSPLFEVSKWKVLVTRMESQFTMEGVR
jgi:hypothetical protein